MKKEIENKFNNEIRKISDNNIAKISKLFPEVITEGKIDFDKLKIVLGEDIDENVEKYEFTWNGKKKMLQSINLPSKGTLLPDIESSVNFDDTNNLYIEGDNLEVLKILRANYTNKIKMIYIDPPYNTGSDFIYKDNFKDSIQNYKEQTDQETSKNPETSGRYHTDWLNMIYPRLRLARELLKEDGVIFISIDDHEQSNLKKVCDEIFGEENFVGDLVRKTKSTTGDASLGFNMQHENTLIYFKKLSSGVLKGEKKTFENYKNPDNDPKGAWIIADPSARTGYSYNISNPYTGKVDLPPENAQWRFPEKRFKEFLKSGKIVFKKNHGDNERGFIYKRYKNEIRDSNNKVDSLFLTSNEYMNQNATKKLLDLFKTKVFDYSKPVNSLRKIIEYSTVNSNNNIILDFFSGSATTAHAIMDLNASDGGNRKYIMVQLPESIDEKKNKSAYDFCINELKEKPTITSIGKERIRRAANKIKEDNEKLLISEKTKRDYKDLSNIDFGFKVFKLDSSNYKENIGLSVDIFVEGRSNEDILIELIIKSGIMLDVKYELVKSTYGEYYNVGSGTMIVCLSDITEELVNDIIENVDIEENPRIYFNDQKFKDDSTKVNVLHNLEVAGLTNVWSL
ncbi:MAG: site-specific DNA-methyltransferase [Mycoplasmatales bacterium]